MVSNNIHIQNKISPGSMVYIMLALLPVFIGGCLETPPGPAWTPPADTGGTGPVWTASEGTVTRIFSSSIIPPGGNFTVTLEPSPQDLFRSPGYQVVETVPEGFILTANTAGIGTNSGNTWTFTNIGSDPIIYTVEGPVETGTYTFKGTFKDQNAAEGVVSGPSVIIVGTSSTASTTSTPDVNETLPAAPIGEKPFNASDFIISLFFSISAFR